VQPSAGQSTQLPATAAARAHACSTLDRCPAVLLQALVTTHGFRKLDRTPRPATQHTAWPCSCTAVAAGITVCPVVLLVARIGVLITSGVCQCGSYRQQSSASTPRTDQQWLTRHDPHPPTHLHCDSVAQERKACAC
jgi:hypothetical protein